MIHHIVVFRFVDGTSEADVGRVVAGLDDLRERIPEIRTYTYGPDAGLAEGNVDFGIVATFDDEVAWRTYAEHPDHQRFIREVIGPLIAERTAVQVHG